ncbi:hypothetical protein HYH03_015507 [Edaphochlamys debaryana]|uniref:Uncharacterized protein n=1 Tax=Edaphochlamys debaryana TaxID=47281 RepID=A0A835XP84_9CHLO|nr:hypothetical protein HYH03_015507 [Edaphochlamys debaryana]|eukprot:KAG2485796.1 hypothetical protein HYH03_015507 [Edaphochlamys debaryana]
MNSVDNLMFMGRRLSVKWFSPERALEGGAGAPDLINLQALQQALHLSQLQPDLMAQLAQMLESPRVPQPQPQPPTHVTAWLDNFVLAQQHQHHQQQQQDSPLAQAMQQPVDFLRLSALSLGDGPAPALSTSAPATAGMASANPTTPTSLDVPDGAVFVTASAGAEKAALAHSRLSKWCAAPGSATAHSSAPPSLADDAGSETASVHASDDSSIATSVHPAGEGHRSGRCTTQGSSPAASETAAGNPAASMTASTADTEEASRNRALCSAGASTRAAVSSDPGSHRPSLALNMQPAVPGAPALAPVRTAACPAGMQHLQRPGLPQAPRPGFSPAAPYPSCGGGMQPNTPEALQHALRMQQALNMGGAGAGMGTPQLPIPIAQQQYVEALTKLAAAREQVVAAASLAGMQVPPHLAAAAASGMLPHGLLGLGAHQPGTPQFASPRHPQQAMPFLPNSGAGPMPDLSALLLFQNAAALNRPLY